MKLPVTVLGGYLGVGKTTLLNHLLREAGGRRLAVLVNDFGDINIDAELIDSREGNVLELAGGCVCCSFGSDLVGALLALPQRQPAPDHVVIETSGVALPGSVARTVGLVSELALDAVIVVVDAETVRERASDRYVGDTVCTQLAQADLVVVNKLDLVNPGTLAGLEDWLQTQAQGARIVHAEHGVVPPALILDSALSAHETPPGVPSSRKGNTGHTSPKKGCEAADTLRNERGDGLDSPLSPFAASRLFPLHADDRDERDERQAADDVEAATRNTRLRPVVEPAAQRFESISLELEGAIDLERLARELVDPALGVLRAKGLLRDPDGRSRWLQLVGTRTSLSAPGHDKRDRSRLVCIGLRGRLDREGIEALLERSRTSD